MQKGTMGMMIASKRKELGMTQMELAEKMGVTDKAVSKWERDLSCPDISSLPKLAEIFGMSVDELMQVKADTKENTDNKVLREESRKLIRASHEAMRRVQQVGVRTTQQVRLGNSMLRPARYFLHLWSSVYGKPLEHRVNIVPFLDNSFAQYMDTVAKLGRDIDIIAATYPKELSGYHCNVLEITQMPFCCAVPSGHRFVERTILEVSDLRGETIIILEHGRDSEVDAARAELEKCPDITLIDTPDYEPATFNQCEATNQLLLSRECWIYAHPMLKTVPINWSYGGPYGLLYAKEPSEDTQLFIDFVKRNLKNGHG